MLFLLFFGFLFKLKFYKKKKIFFLRKQNPNLEKDENEQIQIKYISTNI